MTRNWLKSLFVIVTCLMFTWPNTANGQRLANQQGTVYLRSGTIKSGVLKVINQREGTHILFADKSFFSIDKIDSISLSGDVYYPITYKINSDKYTVFAAKLVSGRVTLYQSKLASGVTSYLVARNDTIRQIYKPVVKQFMTTFLYDMTDRTRLASLPSSAYRAKLLSPLILAYNREFTAIPSAELKKPAGTKFNLSVMPTAGLLTTKTKFITISGSTSLDLPTAHAPYFGLNLSTYLTRYVRLSLETDMANWSARPTEPIQVLREYGAGYSIAADRFDFSLVTTSPRVDFFLMDRRFNKVVPFLSGGIAYSVPLGSDKAHITGTLYNKTTQKTYLHESLFFLNETRVWLQPFSYSFGGGVDGYLSERIAICAQLTFTRARKTSYVGNTEALPSTDNMPSIFNDRQLNDYVGQNLIWVSEQVHQAMFVGVGLRYRLI